MSVMVRTLKKIFLHSIYCILCSVTFISSFSHSLFWPLVVAISCLLRYSRVFSSSFVYCSFVSCLSFYYVLISLPYYLVLPFAFISFFWPLFSVKISENMLIGLYSQRLSACYSSHTTGEYYYNNLLQFVVTFQYSLKSEN